MQYIETTLIALALSMDCFAVSVANGVVTPKNQQFSKILLTACCFGLFQAAMPFLTWYLGANFIYIFADYLPWLSLGILSVIGIKMIYPSLSPNNTNAHSAPTTTSIPSLLLMSFATSIDALATGIVFLPFSLTSILKTIAIIGLITFLMSLIGHQIGKHFGKKLPFNPELIGGIILIAIGIKIVICN